ncbi:hypothetical protein BN2537_15559 [Streptomyces venezuelae]|nr:hypothetical protein BN2537_15559 [Streptomyces venezuelae]
MYPLPVVTTPLPAFVRPGITRLTAGARGSLRRVGALLAAPSDTRWGA